MRGADELPPERALVLAGYLLAGEPASLVPILLRPERGAAERRRLVLALNGRQSLARPAHSVAKEETEYSSH